MWITINQKIKIKRPFLALFQGIAFLLVGLLVNCFLLATIYLHLLGLIDQHFVLPTTES